MHSSNTDEDRVKILRALAERKGIPTRSISTSAPMMNSVNIHPTPLSLLNGVHSSPSISSLSATSTSQTPRLVRSLRTSKPLHQMRPRTSSATAVTDISSTVNSSETTSASYSNAAACSLPAQPAHAFGMRNSFANAAGNCRTVSVLSMDSHQRSPSAHSFNSPLVSSAPVLPPPSVPTVSRWSGMYQSTDASLPLPLPLPLELDSDIFPMEPSPPPANRTPHELLSLLGNEPAAQECGNNQDQHQLQEQHESDFPSLRPEEDQKQRTESASSVGWFDNIQPDNAASTNSSRFNAPFVRSSEASPISLPIHTSEPIEEDIRKQLEQSAWAEMNVAPIEAEDIERYANCRLRGRGGATLGFHTYDDHHSSRGRSQRTSERNSGRSSNNQGRRGGRSSRNDSSSDPPSRSQSPNSIRPKHTPDELTFEQHFRLQSQQSYIKPQAPTSTIASISRRQAAIFGEDEEDDEDRPITDMCTKNGRTFPTTSNNSRFNPPRTVNTDKGNNGSNFRAVVPSSNRAPPTPSSLLSPSQECLIRFYPPSFQAAYHNSRLPIQLPVSINAELTTVHDEDGNTKILSSIFSSPNTYAELMNRLISVEIQGQINRVAVEFARTVYLYEQRKSAPRTSMMQQQQQSYGGGFVTGPSMMGSAMNRMNQSSEKEFQQLCRQHKLGYYDTSCIELTCFDHGKFKKNRRIRQQKEAEKKKRQRANNARRKKQRAGQFGSEEEEEAEEESEPMDTDDANDFTFYLCLKETDAAEKRVSTSNPNGMSEGDIWLLSSDKYFDLGGTLAGQRVGFTPNAWFPTPTRHHFTLLVKSEWRGFSNDNHRMAISPLPAHPSNANTKLLLQFTGEHTRIYALRMSNFKSELDMLNLLNQCEHHVYAAPLKAAPLLPLLLHSKYWPNYRDKYDSQLGWLDPAERARLDACHMQSMKQSKLPELLTGTVGTTEHKRTQFEPLKDPNIHLMPTVIIPIEWRDEVLAEIIKEFPLNVDQLTVIHNVAGWLWTKEEHNDESPQSSGIVLEPTSSPIQLVHGCFGSGQS
jgi:hypothetical protein